MTQTVNDLVRIAAAGGGFTIDASNYEVNDLVRIAAAAQNHKSRIHLTNAHILDTNDLVRIGAAGKGAVSFAL